MNWIDRRAVDRRRIDVGPFGSERRAKERRFRWINFREDLLWPVLIGMVSVGLVIYYLW